MYRSSPFRSTWNSNTNITTAFGMCEVRSEAAHSAENGENAKTITAKTRKWKNAKTRKPENVKRAKTRKRRKRKNAKTAKTRKPENAKTAKTAKTRKPENGESRKAVFASSNKTLQSIKLAIKDARRWERRNTRKRENGKKCSRFLVFWFSRFLVFWFSRFLVFSFSGFLFPLAAPFWPGRVFYVLRVFQPYLFCV